MAGRIKISFHSRVLIIMLLICWISAGIFMIFQYRREKEFKAQLLDTELQMHNARILDDLQQGDSIGDIIRHIGAPLDRLRITLIDIDGNVIYDNNDTTPFPATNHNSRPEIHEARATGTGHAVARYSLSDDATYFYSAMRGDNGTVIRSAAPYDHPLEEFLRADRSLIWITAGLTVIISFIAYLATRKISLSITRLNIFAARAEKGGQIFNDQAFPDDELGSIAGHIVRLYVQRDQRHKEALREQQDKIRLKKQLTNDINHELKTPVASILVCLDLLRDHPELPEDKRNEFIGRIYANAQRLSLLLKDVSIVTRMDEGSGMIEKSPVDLSELIEYIAADARLRTDMTITVTMPPALIVNGNRPLLESIFRNLIDNAIAHSGGSEIIISADDSGTFIVRDNGRGVSAEHLPHIFDRFYRVDKGRSRAAGGTGLGLSIVRNAVAIHGGVISASIDNGLRYDFRIPTINKNATKNQ